ncbi:hypothetical protein ACFL3C_00730 [Patescibacteria group bacterium]
MKRSYKDIPEIASERVELEEFITEPIVRIQTEDANDAITAGEINGPEGFKLREHCITEGSKLQSLFTIHPYDKFSEKKVEGISIIDHFEIIQRYGDPTILNEAYWLGGKEWGAFPLLNPSMMRKLSRKELEKHFSRIRDTRDAETFIQEGPTLILTDRDDEVAAYDGSVERIVDTTKDRVKDTTWAVKSTPGSPHATKVEVDENSSASLVFNVAEYPITEEVNPNGIMLFLDGKHITPSVIAQIVRKAGVRNPLGIHVVVDGEITCSAPHTLPTRAIEMEDLKSPDYVNILKQEGTFIGNGISSALEGHSQDAHIHTNVGHMIEASGKVLVYISPARSEIRVEYADDAIKQQVTQ